MKNTVIASIVAIICTAAVCVTLFIKLPAVSDKSGANTPSADKAYMTETEAADYIGVNEDVMKMMREKLKSFEGAYVSYYYTDAEGKEVNSIVYNREALDKIMNSIAADKNNHAFNFKYIQEAEKAAK